MRATNSLGRSVDLFTDFLPSRLGKWGKKSAEEFLLDTTRHTPRDFLLLLKNIQDVSKDGQPSIDDVYDGIRQYSHSYFLPEIFDELEGYVDADATHQLFQVFEKIGKRELQTKEIIEVIKNNKILNKENVSKILESLFECSAIGNVEYENGHSYFKFKYRNPYAVLDEDKALFLHRGLWRSLNLSGRELE